mmetsp:Transcript_60537/g.100481  ORF Transcript_60537/g.100481 Transcript_60537/m.100481 type:complete len:201 (-) Transcript_60537:13-615(-)
MFLFIMTRYPLPASLPAVHPKPFYSIRRAHKDAGPFKTATTSERPCRQVIGLGTGGKCSLHSDSISFVRLGSLTLNERFNVDESYLGRQRDKGTEAEGPRNRGGFFDLLNSSGLAPFILLKSSESQGWCDSEVSLNLIEYNGNGFSDADDFAVSPPSTYRACDGKLIKSDVVLLNLSEAESAKSGAAVSVPEVIAEVSLQ